MQVVEREQTMKEIEASFALPPDNDAPAPTPIDDEAHQVQLYSITTHDIERLRAKCNALTCDTKEGYDDTRRMIGVLRKTRTRIEKRRKNLNQEHQDAIKFVNGVAKKLTTFVESMEVPLKSIKAAVDERQERIAKELADAELKRIEDERQAVLEAERLQRQAEYKAEQANLKIEADRLSAERAEMMLERKRMDDLLAAERAKAAEQQRLEQERLDKQRREEQERIEAERERVAASQRAAQERIDAADAELKRQQKIVDDARIAAERVEFERRATIKAEVDAKAKAELERLADEQAAIARAAAEQAERARVEAMRPDVERLAVYAQMIRAIVPPIVESDKAQAAVAEAVRRLNTTATDLEAFKP